MCAIVDKACYPGESALVKYKQMLGFDSYEEGYGDQLVMFKIDASTLKDFACCKTLSVMVFEKHLQHEPSMIPGHPN